ncbi:MAG: hypothetical protein ABIJ57_01835 [Pseudomonadota bacterium]
MEYTQKDTGAILDSKIIEIKGSKFFEERLVPHRLFESFRFARPRGSWLLLGCVQGGFWEGSKCRVSPGGPGALVVASIFHPVEKWERVLAEFTAGKRNKVSRRAWSQYRRIRRRIDEFNGVVTR